MNLADAFRDCWEGLAPIGLNAATGGYRRFAWTEEDLACRRWFRSQALARGLRVEDDRNGNLWAWWETAAAARPAVVTGSHLDSVPDGGAFDGPLGVVSALLAVDLLRDAGFRPTRAIAVAVFSDEEGARFGLSCVGSRLLGGFVDSAAARGLRDAAGMTLDQAMRDAGADPHRMGRDDERLAAITAFVELHIEQGRALADLGAPVAVVTRIWPHGRWHASFTGEGNHAGTTRLIDRRDPLLPLASTVLAARRIADECGALATIGRVAVEPNATNAVAVRAHAWLDARAGDDETLEHMIEAITNAAVQAAAEHGVATSVRRESFSPAVDFDVALAARLRDALGRRGAPPPSLPTGAGHDAGILAARIPTAMLVVRNPTGVSHSPDEHADIDDCLEGVRALAAVLTELASE